MAYHDVTLTSNLIYHHEFSWTIKNFSLSPDVLRGPSVPTVPGLPENLYIELNFEQYETGSYYHSSLNLYLKNLNVKNHHLTVSSRTSFRNIEKKVLEEGNASSEEFKESILLLCFDHCSICPFINKHDLSKNMRLSDDKLVVKGKISISGYDTAASVYPIAVEDASKVYEELIKDFKTTYESGSSSDVEFSIGNETLYAHKIILMSRSPVFANMFSSDMVESISNRVVIEDSDFHSFNCFLIFLYTGFLEDKNWDTLLSLYSLANKYQVKSLLAICSRILRNSLTVPSVFTCLELSHLIGDKELKDSSKVFIQQNLFEIAGTTEWVELVTSNPRLVEEVLASQIIEK